MQFGRSLAKVATAALLSSAAANPLLAVDWPGGLRRVGRFVRANSYAISVGALASGSAADAASSWGRRELNGILASRDGRFGAKGAAIKGATFAITFGAQQCIGKRPRSRRIYTICNFAGSGVFWGSAIRNWRLR